MALEQRRMVSVQPQVEEYDIQQSPKKQPKIRRSRRLFTPGEKALFLLFTTILVIISSMILQTEGQLNDANREVHQLNKDIDKTVKQNTELSIQVREKSRYEVVWEKAKELGLNLNDKNVKVVPGR